MKVELISCRERWVKTTLLKVCILIKFSEYFHFSTPVMLASEFIASRATL